MNTAQSISRLSFCSSSLLLMRRIRPSSTKRGNQEKRAVARVARQIVSNRVSVKAISQKSRGKLLRRLKPFWAWRPSSARASIGLLKATASREPPQQIADLGVAAIGGRGRLQQGRAEVHAALGRQAENQGQRLLTWVGTAARLAEPVQRHRC